MTEHATSSTSLQGDVVALCEDLRAVLFSIDNALHALSTGRSRMSQVLLALHGDELAALGEREQVK